MLRGLCVEVLKGRRTRRSPFWLRPPGRAVCPAVSVFIRNLTTEITENTEIARDLKDKASLRHLLSE
jgi:hypothetical protein